MKKLLSTVLTFLLVTFSFAQNESVKIKEVEGKLQSHKVTVNETLTDPSLMSLHSLTPFREVIKNHAVSGPILLVTKDEPGKRITVKGKIVNANGQPVSNELVYVYHTSNKGWYSDTSAHIRMNEGDRRHARLFGYFKTGKNGEFEIHTIKPQGYPESDLPQHIHFEVFSAGGAAELITELLFDDDARLTPAIRKRMSGEGAIIAANSGTTDQPLFYYTVKLK